jgi:hypothetical protein
VGGRKSIRIRLRTNSDCEPVPFPASVLLTTSVLRLTADPPIHVSYSPTSTVQKLATPVAGTNRASANRRTQGGTVHIGAMETP